MSPDIYLEIKNSIHEKFCFMINGPLKTLLFHFFRFSKFQRLVVKNLMKKPPNFIMDFKSSYKVLVSYKFSWSENFRQWKSALKRF